jgi:hypothetical protein
MMQILFMGNKNILQILRKNKIIYSYFKINRRKKSILSSMGQNKDFPLHI